MKIKNFIILIFCTLFLSNYSFAAQTFGEQLYSKIYESFEKHLSHGNESGFSNSRMEQYSYHKKESGFSNSIIALITDYAYDQEDADNFLKKQHYANYCLIKEKLAEIEKTDLYTATELIYYLLLLDTDKYEAHLLKTKFNKPKNKSLITALEEYCYEIKRFLSNISYVDATNLPSIQKSHLYYKSPLYKYKFKKAPNGERILDESLPVLDHFTKLLSNFFCEHDKKNIFNIMLKPLFDVYRDLMDFHRSAKLSTLMNAHIFTNLLEPEVLKAYYIKN